MATNDNTTRAMLLGQLFDHGSCILEDVYENASVRRDALIDALLDNYGYEAGVTRGEVESFLEPFGGATADDTLREVYSWFSDYGVDMHLSEIEIPVVMPERLYAAFTDYRDGDGTTSLTLFVSAAERTENLAKRLTDMGAPIPDETDESTLAEAFLSVLSPTGGTLYLENVNLVEGAWVSEEHS